MTMVAIVSFASTAVNSAVNPAAAITRRDRVFSSAARRSRSGAVTRTFSMRGTASDLAAPRRLAGRHDRPPFGGGDSGGGPGSFGSLIDTSSVGIIGGVHRRRTRRRRHRAVRHAKQRAGKGCWNCRCRRRRPKRRRLGLGVVRRDRMRLGRRENNWPRHNGPHLGTRFPHPRRRR